VSNERRFRFRYAIILLGLSTIFMAICVPIDYLIDGSWRGAFIDIGVALAALYILIIATILAIPLIERLLDWASE
jgi:hypothetical protein